MTDPCKHGSLPRSCEICERDAEIERLLAEVAEKENRVGELETNEMIDAEIIAEKDKRIEELERPLMTNDGILLNRGDILAITTEQIDKAWEYARLLDRRGTAWAGPLLAKLGIVACSGCGGSGEWPDPKPAKDEPCPSCHRNGKSHGWKVVSDE